MIKIYIIEENIEEIMAASLIDVCYEQTSTNKCRL